MFALMDRWNYFLFVFPSFYSDPTSTIFLVKAFDLSGTQSGI